MQLTHSLLACLALMSLAQDPLTSQVTTVPDLERLVASEFRPDGPGGVILVAKGGVPVFRASYGKADLELDVSMRPDHIFRIGSITKQFTAAAVLQLVATGHIRLDDDVREYYPDFATHGKRITIEQVLTHTGGIPNLVDLPDFDSLARHDFSVDELLGLTRHVALHFEPGTGFYYSDTGYILLAAIVQRVTGSDFGDYLNQRIFTPLGMPHTRFASDNRLVPSLATGYTTHDGEIAHPPYMSPTIPHGAGALVSTADDLFTWHRALRLGEVIPLELLERAWRPRTLPDTTGSGYGFGFKICSIAGQRTIDHGGFINGYLAYALQLPSQDLDVIALVNNDADAPDPGALGRRIARYMLTGSPALQTVTLGPSQRAALVGAYRVGTGEELRRIVERAGELVLVRGDRPPAPLQALSPTELTITETDGAVVMTFTPGADGRAASLRASLRCEPLYTATRIGDAGDDAPVPPTGGTEPEFSRDGRRIVFAGGPWPDMDVFVLDTVTGELSTHFQSDSTDYMPSWSPDGRRIVFASTRSGTHDLYVGTIASDAVTRLTRDDACSNTEPRWSPQGNWIAFRSDCDGNREIHVLRADGSRRRRLTERDLEDSEPSWSPDGRRLVFTSYHDGRPEVFVMNGDGSAQRRLTDTPGGYSRRAEWSPDGEWIAFGTNRDGNDEVYLMRADGTDPRNLTRHSAREYYSRWSPDGTSIVFTSNRDANGNGGSGIYTMTRDGNAVRKRYPNHP